MGGRRLAILVVFLLSGFAALVYQVAWQRALFRIYGIDSASVTVIVTAFMLGLGLGSLVGGELSRKAPPLPLFAAFELGIGLFGFWSLDLFDAAGSVTLGLSHLATGLVTFGLVLVPTTLMGATLPLLVAHETRLSGNVGRSVGILYCVNTTGAALACFAAAWILLGGLGLALTTRVAAGLNVLLAAAVLLLLRAPASR